MELELVTFKQAKVLKEVGFPQDKDNRTVVYPTKGEFKGTPCGYNASAPERDRYSINAPSLELVAKWLRKEKDIDLYARPCFEENSQGTYVKTGYTYEISMIPKEVLRTYSSHEDALSAGIDKVIEILKLHA